MRSSGVHVARKCGNVQSGEPTAARTGRAKADCDATLTSTTWPRPRSRYCVARIVVSAAWTLMGVPRMPRGSSVVTLRRWPEK